MDESTPISNVVDILEPVVACEGVDPATVFPSVAEFILEAEGAALAATVSPLNGL